MTCYHPLIRVEDTTRYVKALDGHLYHPAKVYTASGLDPEHSNIIRPYSKVEIIGCGKCIGCRLDNSRNKANQGYCEGQMHPQDANYFVTLTINDDNLEIPDIIEFSEEEDWFFENDGTWGGTLVRRDLQLFMKKLRINLARKYGITNKISVMGCGEYGSKTKRPHYHLIIFGMQLPPEDLYAPKIINKNIYYQSRIIEKSWINDKGDSIGFSNVSLASWNTIAYTARYICKKINGKMSEFLYASQGQIKEFYMCSNRPGIGKSYYDVYWEEIYKNDEIIIKNMDGVHKSKPPKYFDECLKKDHPDLYEEVKEKRRWRMEKNDEIKDLASSLTRLEQLSVEEIYKNESVQGLLREYEKRN